MLDRLRKRLENLLSSSPAPTAEIEPEDESAPPEPSRTQAAVTAQQELEVALAARHEARKREAQLLLSERIHNRVTTLMGQLRDELLQEIHRRLDEEVPSRTLKDLLQVSFDPGFTIRLDGTIDERAGTIVEQLRKEFHAEPDVRLPSPGSLGTELKRYRDQVLRAHILEQLEVFALPPLSGAFPEKKVEPEQLRQRVAQYWQACREALDRFFRSVEMVLLNGARPGIRLDANVIRERLVAAQYRNGYRVLEERLRSLYGKIAQLHMSKSANLEEGLPLLDRQIVDEVIVPLAFFIRDRTQPEPREALESRAELFREIVDKLVASGEPFEQSAEAVKPLLRLSIEQARPRALERFSYLRPSIESLKPSEIHRATALLQLLEALLMPDLDERTLEQVEQNVRLNKSQYHFFLQLVRHYDPSETHHYLPLDRIRAKDAEFLMQYIEETDPSIAALDDMMRHLGYLSLPDPLPDDPAALLRILAVTAISRHELTSWRFLYQPGAVDAELRARLAPLVLRQLRPTSIGIDERQARLDAVPLPVDLSRLLSAAGYRPADADRVNAFRHELQGLVEAGDPRSLRQAVDWMLRLRQLADRERISLGAIGLDADPYSVEVWLKESGEMVGLLFHRGSGFGEAPLEILIRDPAGGNRKEIDQTVRRQLQSQAVIYQSFYKLFQREKLLSRDRRQGLPAYLKTIYEKIQPSRHGLLTHIRNAKALVKRFEQLAGFVLDADPSCRADALAVAQILKGFGRKLDELQGTVEKSSAAAELSRVTKEYERISKYLNVVILHSLNPWLERQTRGLATEFDFREEDVIDAIRMEVASRGLHWGTDVARCEAHRVLGTLGCRALLQLADGSAKAILLEYNRRRRAWQVKHFGPRVTDVIREELRQHGRTLPPDYDEKYEQPTFSMTEQSCRFLYVKRGVARVEATLLLEPSRSEAPWVVVYLKWNDTVLVHRDNPLGPAVA